jgi:uncharacterized membrane protein
MSKAENWQKNWSVTLTPHRSLSREGYIALMAVVAFANLSVGLMFFLVGAWPIVGFLGLDVALIWWAFRRNFSDAARLERITAVGDDITLSRVNVDGTSENTHFNRRWLRVELEYDEFRELVGRLLLRSHGVSHEIASFLGAEERQSLAKALRQAL